MTTDIPKGRMAEDDPKPCWIPVQNSDGKQLKPVIRCNCGELCGIGLHHVHGDGTVTASFYHSEAESFVDNGKVYGHRPGCGWHVWLKLQDYDCGDFPPER